MLVLGLIFYLSATAAAAAASAAAAANDIPTMLQLYSCTCYKSYHILNTSFTEESDCDSGPCKHDGVCSPQDGGFLCDCSNTDFSGDLCGK